MRVNNVLICFVLIAFIGLKDSVGQQLMHYTSERFEYSMQIPEDWKRNDQLKGENLAMVLVSPQDASMSVSFYSISGIDAGEFIDRYQQNLEKQLKGISIQEKGVFKSRDDEATYLLLDYDKEGVRVREKHSFYERKGEVAVLAARQEKEKFHELMPVLEKVFSSFTFETKQEKVDNSN
ncbi:MAG TPA: hypothetical protein DCX54_08525 [Flavobacteriales bacterium]|nr:hypothetical protein [Flavobacteriales bacterium]